MVDEMMDMQKQKVWGGGNFDDIYYFREYPMNTRIVHGKLKTQWPLGFREFLNVYGISYDKEKKTLIMAGKSIEHAELPRTPGILRLDVT